MPRIHGIMLVCEFKCYYNQQNEFKAEDQSGVLKTPPCPYLVRRASGDSQELESLFSLRTHYIL